VPSTWDEPLGMVAIEAQAVGCRVVASRVGGLPEAVGPHSTLVAAGDVEALGRAVIEAASQPLSPNQQREQQAWVTAHFAQSMSASFAERALVMALSPHPTRLGTTS
jgi:glycosyltransferase involved in cell wall biosynthesis